MAKAILKVLTDPKQTPEWSVERSTDALPKKVETWIAENYKPISCLSTGLKILTSIL